MLKLGRITSFWYQRVGEDNGSSRDFGGGEKVVKEFELDIRPKDVATSFYSVSHAASYKAIGIIPCKKITTRLDV